MNPEPTNNPREELELRVTALLLGELNEAEAAAVRGALAQDPELQKLHDDLKQTIHLVREATVSTSGPEGEQTEPLRLEEGRRKSLLTAFAIPPLKPEHVAPWQKYKRAVVGFLAVLILTSLLAVTMVPKLAGRGEDARKVAIRSQVQSLETAKVAWAVDHGKSAGDEVTFDDLKSYFGDGHVESLAGEKYVLGKVGEPVVAQLPQKERWLALSPARKSLAAPTDQPPQPMLDLQGGTSFKVAPETREFYAAADNETAEEVTKKLMEARATENSRRGFYDDNYAVASERQKGGALALERNGQAALAMNDKLAEEVPPSTARPGIVLPSMHEANADTSLGVDVAANSSTWGLQVQKPAEGAGMGSQSSLATDGGESESLRLRFADSGNVKSALESLGEELGFDVAVGNGSVTLSGTVKGVKAGKDLVEQLDMESRQVLVDAAPVVAAPATPQPGQSLQQELSEVTVGGVSGPAAGRGSTATAGRVRTTTGAGAALSRRASVGGAASDDLAMGGNTGGFGGGGFGGSGGGGGGMGGGAAGGGMRGGGRGGRGGGAVGVSGGGITGGSSVGATPLPPPPVAPPAAAEQVLTAGLRNSASGSEAFAEQLNDVLQKRTDTLGTALGTVDGTASAGNDYAFDTRNSGIAPTAQLGWQDESLASSADGDRKPMLGDMPQMGHFFRTEGLETPAATGPGTETTAGGLVKAGSGALNMNGGSLTVNGVNTYSGGTAVNGGTLQFGGMIAQEANRPGLPAPGEPAAGFGVATGRNAETARAQSGTYPTAIALGTASVSVDRETRGVLIVADGATAKEVEMVVRDVDGSTAQQDGKLLYENGRLEEVKNKLGETSDAATGGDAVYFSTFTKQQQQAGQVLARESAAKSDLSKYEVAGEVDKVSREGLAGTGSRQPGQSQQEAEKFKADYAQIKTFSEGEVSARRAVRGSAIVLPSGESQDQQKLDSFQVANADPAGLKRNLDGLDGVPSSNRTPATTAPTTSGLDQATRQGTQSAQVAEAGEKGLQLNFRNVPMEQVLSYLSEAGGMTIASEVDVRGRVSVWSNQRMTKEEAVELLNSELAKQGLAVLQDGKQLTITTQTSAVRASGTPVMVGYGYSNIPRDNQIVTQRIPVRFISAAQAARALQPLMTPQTTMGANQGGNELVITATPERLQELSRIIETLDVPPAMDIPLRKSATNAPIPQAEIQTATNNFSTFSLNVSDVSFKLAAASLEQGQMPEASTIRSEEFINAFDYRDPEPPAGAPIAFAWERAGYPFAHNRDLLRFSMKTAAQGRQAGRPLNIVLLLDNSGSMERADRVQIIREALRVLASQLHAQDKLSVITFARTPRLVVDGVAGDKAGAVAGDVGGLTPQGGTNLEDAMNLAYQTAKRHYLANGVNRVVVLTDGAANLGNVEPEALKQQVESNRKQGIALDCFGIGWEGFNDDLLEVLSRNGDGRYGFINSPAEAASDFAGQLAGALKVAASDVKVQVEFNWKRVTSYRQIGYAKHQLKKEQFRDNTVDAAEIAAQEAGNALYTVEVNPNGSGPLGTVRVRYKVPGTTQYREQSWDVPYTGSAVALDQASPAMRLAATASAFSEWLVVSPYAGEVTPDALLGYLSGVPEVFGADARPKKLEWMIRQAKSVAGN